jgi:hypothetical protein
LNALETIRDPGPDPAELACQAEEPEASPSWDPTTVLDVALASIRWCLAARTDSARVARLRVVLSLLEKPDGSGEVEQMSRTNKHRLFKDLLHILAVENGSKWNDDA